MANRRSCGPHPPRALGAALTLACGIGGLSSLGCLAPYSGSLGDRLESGCPVGVTCSPGVSGLTHDGPIGPRCGGPVLFDFTGGSTANLQTLGVGVEAVFRVQAWLGTTSTTVAAHASVTGPFALSADPEGSLPALFRLEATGVGTGAIEVVDDAGLLVDRFPIAAASATRVEATDGISCPGDPVALRADHEAIVGAWLFDGSGRVLFDPGVVVDGSIGDTTFRPAWDARGAFLRIEPSEGGELPLVVPVVDHVDEVVRVGIADGADPRSIESGEFVCFVGRADGATLLGLPVALSPGDPALETLPLEGTPCSLVLVSGATSATELPLDVEIAGVVGRFTVRVP